MRIVGLLGVLAASATALVLAQAAPAGILVSDRSDIRIHTGSYAANGVEPNISVHPDDWRILAVSIAADSGCAGWTSGDGGASWYGDNAAAHSRGFGDGVVAIQRTGATTRYFILSLSSAESDSSRPFDEGQRVVWKTALQSNTWGNQAFPSPVDSATDKGWLYAENSTGLQTSGNLYAAWFMPKTEGLRFATSSNNGASWTTPAYKSDPLPQVLPGESEVQPPLQELLAEGHWIRRVLRINGFRPSEGQLAERQRRGAHAAGWGIRSAAARARRGMWSGTARACRGR